MTKAAQRLREIAERLPPDRQQILLDIAEGLACPSRFLDVMTTAERAELDEAIAEADRGESLSQEDVDQRLAILLRRAGK